jgi:hypothetical protein
MSANQTDPRETDPSGAHDAQMRLARLEKLGRRLSFMNIVALVLVALGVLAALIHHH